MKLYFLTLVTLFLITCIPIQAKEINDIDNSLYLPVGEWVLGVSVGYGKLINPLNKQDDIPLYVLPDIRYYGENFSIENLDIAYNLFQRKNLIIELIGQQNIDGIYFPGKNRKLVASLAGIPGFGQWEDENVNEPELPTPNERSLSYMAGAELRYYGYFDYLLSSTTDISNVHHGQEVKALLHKLYNFDPLIIEFETGAIFKSKKLTQYYYGLELPIGIYEENIYTPTSAINYHLKIDLTYIVNNHWYVVSTLKNEWLDSTISNSPIVVKDQTQSFFIGIKYVY